MTRPCRAPASPQDRTKPAVCLRFLGHAAFDLQMGGLRLCLDPHRPGALGGRVQLPEIQGPFDWIARSHGHEDHAAWTPALGTRRIIDGPADLPGVAVTARSAFHDAARGLRMGLVRMLSFHDGATRVVHCGDLGSFDAGDVAWLAGTDVLLVPVGGTFTLDGQGAAELVRQVQPRYAIPMHAADSRVDLRLEPIDGFLAAWAGTVTRLRELCLGSGAQPPAGVVVLAPPA